MRFTLLVGLLLVSAHAAAQPAQTDPLTTLASQLSESSDPYARAEHPRIMGWIRDATERVAREPAGPCRGVAEDRLRALARVLAEDPAASRRVWEVTRRITVGLSECGLTGEPTASLLEVEAWLRSRPLGWFASGAATAGPRGRAASGHVQVARRRWELALASFAEARVILAGVDDPVVAADVARGIGTVHGAQGRDDEAIASMEEAIRIASAAGPRGRRAEADAWLLLGYVHAGAHRYADAIAAYERARALRVLLVGEDDPWTVELDNARAVSLGQLRRHADALVVNRRVLEVRRRALGDAHPDTLISRSNIAAMLIVTGDTAGALAATRELLAERERWLPPNDPGLAVTLVALAQLEGRTGSPELAETLLRRSIAIRETLPERHPDRGRSHAELAGLLLSRGRADEALPLAERALVLMREARGDIHPDVAAYWGLVARCAERAGRVERATEARAAQVSAGVTP